MEMLDYALLYQSRGLYVLPMYNKKPMISFADKDAMTADEIKYVWGQYPDANIAVRTVDFFVIDVDEHTGGQDGISSIDEFNKKFPGALNETLVQNTAHNGQQYFYRKPKDFDITQIIGWLPGVDIKAHINNYVMVAPSQIDDKQYKFVNNAPINYPSDKLVELIKKVYEQNHKESFSGNGANLKPVQKTGTTELFDMIARGLGTKGSRNDNLTKLVGGLFVRGVNTDEAYILACITNENSSLPLSDKELIKTFMSVQKNEIKRREAISKHEKKG